MLDKENLVVQANKLIMSSQDMEYEEKRFFICLVSQVNPEDEDFKMYKVSFQEYASFLSLDYDNVKKTLPKITKKLMKKVIEYEDDDCIYQWSVLCKAIHLKKTGDVYVQFHPDLKPMLLGLKGHFTMYKLEYILKLKSKHAIRMYEIIKANEFKDSKYFRLSWNDNAAPKEYKKMLADEYSQPDIQKLFGTSYKKFYEFEKYVLKPAQEELLKHTDVFFTYEKAKEGRFLFGIDFYIYENVPTEKHVEQPNNIIPSSPDISSITEMAAAAENTINNFDRGKLCKMFQSKVKEEYGVDMPLSMLEGLSNMDIAHILPQIGSWRIKSTDPVSVLRYIKKVLSNYKEQKKIANG
jgi:plasmid replication initiation protein